MQGYQETCAARVRVFKENERILTFGVGHGHHEMDGDSAPLLTLQVSRQINRPGACAFALPGLSELHTGKPWSSLIELGDFVQVDATVQRSPGKQSDDAGYSHKWRTLFFGRVVDLEDIDIADGGGFGYSTTVTCDDFLGSLETPRFNYWLNLGEAFGDVGELRDKLSRLKGASISQHEVSTSSTAVAAHIMLTSMIEGRLDISRKIGKQKYDLKDTYGYRFESDDLQTIHDLKQLAPDGQTWKAALESVVDAPHFYELFQDSLPKGAADKPLAADKKESIGRSHSSQFRSRAPKYVGEGGYGEVLVMRPAPFPVYRDEVDSAGKATGKAFYSQAAWEALPLIKAAPFAHSNLRVEKSRRSLFSVYSVNVSVGKTFHSSENNTANAQMQIVGDLHKLLHTTGYVPLDVSTIRLPTHESGKVDSMPQLVRTLSYQLFSYNQLNDIYMNGSSEVPLDLRVQLGTRWIENDMMFYIEGYRHTITPEGASTSLTLTRGLPVEYYGHKPTQRPIMGDKMDYVKKYLGRKRPEDKVAPRAARAIMNELNDDETVSG